MALASPLLKQDRYCLGIGLAEKAREMVVEMDFAEQLALLLWVATAVGSEIWSKLPQQLFLEA